MQHLCEELIVHVCSRLVRFDKVSALKGAIALTSTYKGVNSVTTKCIASSLGLDDDQVVALLMILKPTRLATSDNDNSPRYKNVYVSGAAGTGYELFDSII
jgi:hypothetical protein